MKFSFFSIYGITSLYIDIPDKYAPTSIRHPQSYYMHLSIVNFHNGFYNGGIYFNIFEFFNTKSIIFASVDFIVLFSLYLYFMYVGNNIEPSLVPENPTDCSTQERSQEDEVIIDGKCIIYCEITNF